MHNYKSKTEWTLLQILALLLNSLGRKFLYIYKCQVNC